MLPHASIFDVQGGYVLPGLIDAHLHFGLTGSINAYEFWKASPLLRSLAMYRNGLIALINGITAVRDVGAIDHSVIDYARQVADRHIIGPTVVPAGQFIVMTGGHGWDWGRQADGPDDVRRAVREQIRAGARVIKFMATGGLSTPGNAESPELTLEELKAGIEEAHKAGLRAAAHAHNAAGIMAAVEAGIDSIEHAALAGNAEFQLLRDRGVILVPTIVAISHIQPGQGLDEDVVAKTEAARERFHEAIRRAIAIGVGIAAGTDAGTSLNPIGRVVDEMAEYVQLGMQSEEALLAGTVTAGRLLGIEAGVIAEGRPADLLVVRDDPRSNLEALRQPAAVIANGRNIDLSWARATVRSLPNLGPIFGGLDEPTSSTVA